MLSAIIDCHESERALVRTLAALVPGATAGLLSEVIVADAGSGDDTEEIADIAGCRFMSSERAAGRAAEGGGGNDAHAVADVPARRLRAGAGLDRGQRAIHADETTPATVPAAPPCSARPASVTCCGRAWARFSVLLRVACGGRPKPEQGLLIARRLYLTVGGHSDGADADAALLRKLGRRRIAMLPAAATATR